MSFLNPNSDFFTGLLRNKPKRIKDHEENISIVINYNNILNLKDFFKILFIIFWYNKNKNTRACLDYYITVIL